MPKELPDPEGWARLEQTRESRIIGELDDGRPVEVHFVFNNYMRTQDDDGVTRLMLMSLQVHEDENSCVQPSPEAVGLAAAEGEDQDAT
jgi:hypothetical protein